ncbi:hypothetical protein J5X84_28770 [Streptosporangiaceae bacterium NEAU-GS5]|nr:hypothetical protein [Streptosporangiaceae bacterium NEAU-GS5]
MLAGIGATAPAASAAEWRVFGIYYTEQVCHMYGDSLIAAHMWQYYNCYYDYYAGDNQYHWYLWVYG